MAYTHLFFDLDHTLWDFDANAKLTLEELYQNLQLKERGVDEFDRFYERYIYHNEQLWERYRNGFIKQEELRLKRMWRTLLDFKIGDEALARQMSHFFIAGLPTRTQLFPETLEVLDYLQSKNYELHLITNGFEEVQHQKLKYSGLSPYFGAVVTSQGSNSLKPDKEIFEYAFRLTGANPGNSIMIGDNIEVDIKGAKNAGMDQVHVNYTGVSAEINPTFTISALRELKEIF